MAERRLNKRTGARLLVGAVLASTVVSALPSFAAAQELPPSLDDGIEPAGQTDDSGGVPPMETSVPATPPARNLEDAVGSGHVDPLLLEEFGTDAAEIPTGRAGDKHTGAPVEVVVSFNATDQQGQTLGDDQIAAAIDGVVASLGAAVVEAESFHPLPAAAIVVTDLAAVEQLMTNPAVERVDSNREIEAGGSGHLGQVRQPEVAARGHLGQGAQVAVLDTGADWTHPSFGNCTKVASADCSIKGLYEIAPNDHSRDDDGHGTNVAGIVHEVAPRADLLVYDVFYGTPVGNKSSTTYILRGLSDVLRRKNAGANIVAVNMSLGDATSYTAANCPRSYRATLERLYGAGIIPVVSAGNEEFTAGVSAPACDPYSLAVGAVDEYDRVAWFSNSANEVNMLAPGTDIHAAGITMSGTSMAAPHVAGALAVVASAAPHTNAYDRWSVLQSNGTSVSDPANGVTRKRLDLQASLNRFTVCFRGFVTATPTGYARSGWTRSEVPKHHLFVDWCSRNGSIIYLKGWNGRDARGIVHDSGVRASNGSSSIVGRWTHETPAYLKGSAGRWSIIDRSHLDSTGPWGAAKRAWTPKINVHVSPDGSWNVNGTDRTGATSYWSPFTTATVLTGIDVQARTMTGLPADGLCPLDNQQPSCS